MVHRFITKDTFEERINDMIQQKKHLADMTVASGESWIGKLSNKSGKCDNKRSWQGAVSK